MKFKSHQSRSTKHSFVASYCTYSTKKSTKNSKRRLQQAAAKKAARYNGESF